MSGWCDKKRGWWIVYAPDCPFSHKNGNIKRSRYVAWKAGLLTQSSQVVHHKDGNQENDVPENLAILENQAVHASWHNKSLKRTPEHCARMSDILRALPELHAPKTEAHKRKIGDAHRGMPVKMSCAICGKPNSNKRSHARHAEYPPSDKQVLKILKKLGVVDFVGVTGFK